MKRERKAKLLEDRVNLVVTMKLKSDLDAIRSTINLNLLTGKELKMLNEEREFQDLLGKDEEDIAVYKYIKNKKAR